MSKNNGEKAFCTMFPNQATLIGKGVGNLISLPLQGKASNYENTLFLDPETGFEKPYEDQGKWIIETLKHRISEKTLDKLISKWGLKSKEEPYDESTRSFFEAFAEQARAMDYPPAQFDDVQNGCGWVNHCVNDAKHLSEPEWYNLLTIVVRCEEGPDVCHRISNPYPDYSYEETQAKIEHALEDSGPSKCSTIKKTNSKFCKTCQHWGRIKSPIVLGMMTSQREAAENINSEFNEKHAVIMLGGKCCIMNETIDPVFNRPDISFSSKTDFLNMYANQKIWNPDSHTKQISVAKLWWESPNRRQYKGVVFEPQKDFEGYYNLWRGFAVEPKKGDWSLMQQLIRDCISSGKDERYKYVLVWMARIIQDPGGQRPGVSLVTRGRQGVGKGVFSTNFGSLFGQHFLQVAQSSQVTGRFNNHLKDCVLLFVDEGFWAGDKQAEGVIRNLVTEPTIIVEPKGKDIFKVKNNVNIIIASNADWVVPAGLDERRFFTVDVSDCFKGNYDFFQKLSAQMDNGGREAMFYDLQMMDISDVDLREFERTDALLEQIIESMTLVQKWWFSLLRRGTIMLSNPKDWCGPKEDFWPKMVSNEELYENFEIFTQKLRGHIPVQEVFGRQLNKLMGPVEYVRQSFVEGGPRKRGRIIPPLNDCRKVFEELLSMEVDWDREKEEYILF